MRLRAQTANIKLKQNLQALYGDGLHDFFVLYMTQLGAISEQKY